MPENNASAVVPDRNRYALYVITAVTFLVYAGTLSFKFVYDDIGQIVDNPAVRSWHFLPQYFASHIWEGLSLGLTNYYRPLDLVWFRINFALFGLNAFGWHLTSILVHIAATVLVFRLIQRLFAETYTAALAALIFGLHPIHVQSVAWASGIADPLIVVFFIASFLSYLKWRDTSRKVWLFWSLLLYACAALTKETGVVLPAIVFLQECIRPSERTETMIARLRASFTAVLPFLAVSIGYLGARFHALRGFAPAVHPLSFSEMVLTWPSILWSYARHLFAPWGYSLYYDFSPVQHLLSREFILPFASLVLLLSAAFAVYRLLKVPRDLFLSACVWFTVPLAPCLYLRAIEPYIFGQDRYLYVSVIGFALFVSAVLVRLPSPHLEESASRRLHLYAGAIIGTILACCTLIQQQYWVNNVALFRRAVTIAPHNTPALNNLAVALAERNDFADAIAIFNRDLQQDPNSARLNYNYGYVLYRKQDYGKALPLFSRAAALDPGMGEAFLYIGMSQLKLGDAQDAAVEIRRAIALEPERRGAHLALGAALEAQGNFSGALDETKIEASRFPDDKLINLRLASLEKSSRQQR